MIKKDTLLYVVAHNHEKYLEQSLDSLFSQLDPKTDVILIDSGSRDKSKIILQKYADKFNVKLFRKKMILTDIIDWVYSNFLDKYDFIIRLDADDSLRSGAIKTLKKHINRDKKIGSVVEPEEIGIELANILKSQGAGEILQEIFKTQRI